MNLLKTFNFELATYTKGEPNSEKVALVLPGRLETKDYAHIRSHVNHLANLGFYSLSFDPPGTWESPGDLSIYTTSNYLKAVNELIEILGNRETLIVGHSKGGNIAMLAGCANPLVESFVAIMASAAPATVDEEWKSKGSLPFYRDLPPGDRPSAEQKRFDLPYSYYENSLLNDLSSNHKPKLFVLGTHDHQDVNKDVKEAYGVSAAPKRLYELNSGHGYRYDKQVIENLNEEITTFVQEYNLI